MFETSIGPVKDAGSTVYLRPETAQGIFLAFKTTLGYARKKPPFGIAQIGKSFRNEITPGNFIFRMSKFEQMEMEFFVLPAEAERWHQHWMDPADVVVRVAGRGPRQAALRAARRGRAVPLRVRHQRHRVPVPDRLVGQLQGIANRGDFDLTQHAEHSGSEARVRGHRQAVSATSRT